jgi:hypothetical protein
MRKFAWLVLLSFVLTMLMGCIAARPRVAPPPLKKEVRPHKPGPNFVWIPGHWKWSGGRYVWVRGVLDQTSSRNGLGPGTLAKTRPVLGVDFRTLEKKMTALTIYFF